MSDDRTIEDPFGRLVVWAGDPADRDAIQDLVAARGAFATEYARSRGWIGVDDVLDPEALSWEQVMEIRAQPGWKNPFGAEA